MRIALTLLCVVAGGCGDRADPSPDASVNDAAVLIGGDASRATCEPRGDAACDACLRTSCCAETQRCLSNAPCAAILSCFDGCGSNDACRGGCEDSHLDADPLALGGVIDCMTAHCVNDCALTVPTSCSCSSGCCPEEAPTACLAGNADDACGGSSARCAVCGSTKGCRATPMGVACIEVATAGQPCTRDGDCKSRSCISGACAATTCLAGGATCGAGHVGMCCPGLACQSSTCCAVAGTTLPPQSSAQCCPGSVGQVDPLTGVIHCG